MDLSPANIHDIRYLSDLKNSLTNCVLVGDKGYLSVSEQVDLFTHYNVRLEVPYRCNQLNRPPTKKGYQRLRRRIETNFSQLDDQLMIRKNYAKTQRGFFMRILSKITAFTVLQFFNWLCDKPIGLIKSALTLAF